MIAKKLVVVIFVFVVSLKIVNDNKDFDGVHYTSRIDLETKIKLRDMAYKYIKSEPDIIYSEGNVQWNNFFNECDKHLQVCKYFDTPEPEWYSLNEPKTFIKIKSTVNSL